MSFLWRVFYNVVAMPLFWLFAHVYSLFNAKAKESLEGRKGMFRKLSEKIASDSGNHLPVIWFHCSSVGELEQAKPIIASMKSRARIALTLFSPSGYSAAMKYTEADLVCYMPFDTAGNARRMFRLLNPAALIFMRFDIWPNHVWRAAKMNVPVILADATLHEKSKRQWPVVRSFLKSVHKHIKLHCAISESDARRLMRICPKDAKILVTGDTRFDQVIARSKSAGRKLEGMLPDFDAPVIIVGSTYIECERIVIEAYHKVLSEWGRAQLILVPHEPEPYRLAEIGELMSQRNLPYVLLSEIAAGRKLNGEAIVVDRVGVLAELYLLGDITFIGGSFHGSVHNVMEPAIMGKPVIFGPTIHNSLEALMLKERGAGIMVSNSAELASELIRLLKDDELRKNLGKSAQAMVEENAGATDKIVTCINEILN